MPDPFALRRNSNARSIRYKVDGHHGAYRYAFGVERLGEYRDFIDSGQDGRLLAGTYVVKGGWYGSELRRIMARGGQLVVSQGLGEDVERLRRRYGSHAIQIYREGQPGFQHLKYVYVERDGQAAFRLSSGPLATIDLGLGAVGAKGIGRTELFFQTTHPDICREGLNLHQALVSDEAPSSGRHLLLQTEEGDDLLPAIIGDVERLSGDGAEIVHARASIACDAARMAHASSANLMLLHDAIERAIRRGVRCWVLSDATDRETREACERFYRSGALIGIPAFLPGSSRIKRWPLRVPMVGRWFRRRSSQEHYNVTIVKQRRTGPHEQPHAVVYFGTKRDAPQVRQAVDGMLRLESSDFPGLAEGLTQFILHRYSGRE